MYKQNYPLIASIRVCNGQIHLGKDMVVDGMLAPVSEEDKHEVFLHTRQKVLAVGEGLEVTPGRVSHPCKIPSIASIHAECK